MNGVIAKSHLALKPMVVFSLEERRFFTFCLQYYDSRKDKDNPRYFDVSLDEFKGAFPEYVKRKPAQVFHACKNAISGIQQKPYFSEEDGESYWWFSSLKVTDEKIRFGLSPEVMPFFLNLKDHFISYHMADVKFLGKPTAWSLYEYLKERYMNGNAPAWTVEVDDLKERLGVAEKYERFGNFDTKCLKQPLAEINRHTDLIVDYKKKKKGVRVYAIIFNVKTKPKDVGTIDVENLAQTFEQEQLRHGISAAAAKRNTERAEKDGKLSQAIKAIESSKKSWQKHGKGPFAGYLAGTLTSLLFEKSIFQDDQEKAVDNLKHLDNKSLEIMEQAGNVHAGEILKTRK